MNPKTFNFKMEVLIFNYLFECILVLTNKKWHFIYICMYNKKKIVYNL